MKKRGSILPYIVILAVGAFAVNWFYGKYSAPPSKLTQDTAAAVFKYPNSQTWTQNNKKGICTFSAENCSLPSTIAFTTADDWATVYKYYVTYMPTLNWKTNSQIYTSIPTGVLFTNDLSCEAELTPKRKGIFEFSDSKTGKYYFKITCPINPR